MISKKFVVSGIAAAIAASAALPALAAPHHHAGPGMRGPMQDMMFVRLLKTADTDKDGKISKAEITAYQDKLFTAIDANKDGSLTRGELLDYRQGERQAWREANPRPERAEKAEDGKKAEAGDRRDGDRPHRHHVRADRHGPKGGKMGHGFFRMIDEDRDGKITKTEVTAASEKLLARMDANKDGVISIDDLPNRPL